MIITLMTGASQYGFAQIGISSISTLAGANLGEISLQMSDAGPYQIEVSSADGDIVCTLSDVRSYPILSLSPQTKQLTVVRVSSTSNPY